MLAGNNDIVWTEDQSPYLLSAATLCISKVPPIINYWAEEKQVPASAPEIPVSRVEYVFLTILIVSRASPCAFLMPRNEKLGSKTKPSCMFDVSSVRRPFRN